VNLHVWAWAQNANDYYTLQCDLLQAIKRRFDAEGIEIPFPQRGVTITNPIQTETIHGN